MSPSVFGIDVDTHIKSTAELREIAKAPSRLVTNKVINQIDDLSARFIAASPLLILSTAQPDGTIDSTPRGDPPGFVAVLNKTLLAIPDRPGNNRMDTFENLFENPKVGLIFLIPGHNDTLRVAGTGALVRDAALGEKLAINGRPSELVLLIKVEHVLCHCAKAFVRSRAWYPEEWPDTSNVPTLAELMVAHGSLCDTIEEMDEIIQNDRKNRLY